MSFWGNLLPRGKRPKADFAALSRVEIVVIQQRATSGVDEYILVVDPLRERGSRSAWLHWRLHRSEGVIHRRLRLRSSLNVHFESARDVVVGTKRSCGTLAEGQVDEHLA